jgi:general secretion pathway protein J
MKAFTVFRRTQSGFTLLEVLIATVLLAIMMTLLLGSLRVGAGSWEQGERRAEQASRLLVTHNFFRSYLSGALPLLEAVKRRGMQGRGGAGAEIRAAGMPPMRPGLSFRGFEDVLEYAATLPPQVRGGLYKFRLYVSEQAGQKDLKVAIRPFSAADEEDPSIEEVTLLEGIESLRIAYFGKAAAEEGGFSPRGPQWLDEWEQPFMPALIRVEITMRGEPPWPPLVVAPRVELLR